jgi:fucose 4-O-acetylase-like acetyltransferase
MSFYGSVLLVQSGANKALVYWIFHIAVVCSALLHSEIKLDVKWMLVSCPVVFWNWQSYCYVISFFMRFSLLLWVSYFAISSHSLSDPCYVPLFQICILLGEVVYIFLFLLLVCCDFYLSEILFGIVHILIPFVDFSGVSEEEMLLHLWKNRML